MTPSFTRDEVSGLTGAIQTDKSYELTVAGMELGTALQHVWDWSERWSADLRSTR